MMKTAEDYKIELRTLDTSEKLIRNTIIPRIEKAIINLKDEKREALGIIEELKKDFNRNIKAAKRNFHIAERERSRGSRELANQKKNLADIPRKRSYCMRKIKELTQPKESSTVAKEKQRKATDGKGIESLAEII